MDSDHFDNGYIFTDRTLPAEKPKVHVFLESGNTYTFEGYVAPESNESVLLIEYTAMSDGRKKRAVFYTSHIVGYSFTY